MIRALSAQKLPRGKKARIQVRMVGTATLSEDDTLRKYELLDYVMKPGSQKATVRFYSDMYSSKRMVLNSAQKALKSQLSKEMQMKEVTLLVRQRK